MPARCGTVSDSRTCPRAVRPGKECGVLGSPREQACRMTLLAVRDLRVAFRIGKRTLQAVDGIDLEVEAGTTFGLVGESGSGKTTVARAIVGLTPLSGGVIELNGE